MSRRAMGVAVTVGCTRTSAVARFTAKGGSGVRTARLIVRRAR
jgi:hypothetical protein